MRNLVYTVIISLALMLFFPEIECADAFEIGYDRPGGELVGKYTNVATAQQCYQLCTQNQNCVAFTWVKPNIQGPTGVCWLKGSLSNKVKNNCCVSGVVRAARQDQCKWHQQGTTYSCYCRNSKTGKWYMTNPGACPQQKPPPKYVDQNKKKCPPGHIWVGGTGVFGQGSGGYCKKK